MSARTPGEQTGMAARACELDPESVIGFVTVAITADGPVVASSAARSAVIIETLAHVIETLAHVIESLASRLADGIDMQADAAGAARRAAEKAGES